MYAITHICWIGTKIETV